ncbi:MAG: hypothetical protein COC15_03630 [Legionellales bacterium]|nr:MAG: hypothetical protein COC15_03630 [Legionellales bacterium]
MNLATTPQILLGLCAISYSISLYADMNKHKNAAVNFAKGMLQQSGSVKSGFRNKKGSYSAEDIADSKARDEAESFGNKLINRENQLPGLAANGIAKNQGEHAAGNLVLRSERSRKRIKDIKESELFQRSEETINNPKDALAAVENNNRNCVKVPINPDKVVGRVIKECEITKRAEIHTCMHNLNVEVQITPAKYYHHWCRQKNHEPDDPKCTAKAYYNPALKHSNETFKEFDTWISECVALERRPECKIIKTKYIYAPSTRIVKCNIMKTNTDAKTPEDEITKEKKIIRDHWHKEVTYSCQYPITPGKDCAILRKEGCEAIYSKCMFQVQGTCYKWTQRYECLKKQENVGPKFKLVCNQKNTFCLHGECFAKDHTKGDVGNLGEAIANLQVFKEIQDDNSKALDMQNGKLLYIFKGKKMACEKETITFWQDCCKMKGWLKKSCSEEAAVLQKKREKKLCHQVGQYCSKYTKIPPKIGIKVCIRKKTTFCCFTSRLMLAIHESGRSQLGIGWGNAKNPDCRGLTPDEIAKIDFSKVDLSFLYEDIKSRLKKYDMQRISESVNEKISNMQHSLTSIRKTKEGEC